MRLLQWWLQSLIGLNCVLLFCSNVPILTYAIHSHSRTFRCQQQQFLRRGRDCILPPNRPDSSSPRDTPCSLFADTGSSLACTDLEYFLLILAQDWEFIINILINASIDTNYIVQKSKPTPLAAISTRSLSSLHHLPSGTRCTLLHEFSFAVCIRRANLASLRLIQEECSIAGY